jgi:hypothetical protein
LIKILTQRAATFAPPAREPPASVAAHYHKRRVSAQSFAISKGEACRRAVSCDTVEDSN